MTHCGPHAVPLLPFGGHDPHLLYTAVGCTRILSCLLSKLIDVTHDNKITRTGNTGNITTMKDNQESCPRPRNPK